MTVSPLNANLATAQSQQAHESRILERAQGKDAKLPKDIKEVRKLSEDFEALFLNILMKSMRDTVPDGGLIDGGNAEKIYRSMLDQEYANLMASQRNTGIADNIQEFLLRSMGEAEGSEPTQAAQESKGLKAYGAQRLQETPKQETIESGDITPQT